MYRGKKRVVPSVQPGDGDVTDYLNIYPTQEVDLESFMCKIWDSMKVPLPHKSTVFWTRTQTRGNSVP